MAGANGEKGQLGACYGSSTLAQGGHSGDESSHGFARRPCDEQPDNYIHVRFDAMGKDPTKFSSYGKSNASKKQVGCKMNGAQVVGREIVLK